MLMEDFKSSVFTTNFFLHRCQELAESVATYTELKGENHPMTQLIDETLTLNRRLYEIAKTLEL